MPIELIHHHAEEELRALVEESSKSNATAGLLHFKCSKLPSLPEEEDVLLTIEPALEGRSATIYFFRDGNIVILWRGVQKAVLDALTGCLYERYAPQAQETLHRFYDLQAHADGLRLLCLHGVERAVTETVPASLPAPTPWQESAFRGADGLRLQRDRPLALIVQDHAFARNQLVGMVEDVAAIYAAADASTAWEFYCTHAPDIAFLGIDLPGIDGYHLATAICALDKEAYIVMVTAHHQLRDVMRAKASGAKGFIVKPYSREKILESIGRCRAGRKVKPRGT